MSNFSLFLISVSTEQITTQSDHLKGNLIERTQLFLTSNRLIALI